tara:strand:- start:726 stop:1145 length:420 start_codon:yes stop_codon:yes gene_type:complete
MAARRTTIHLGNQQYTWAKANIPNLSHFVRTKIAEEQMKQAPIMNHTKWVDSAKKCYPHTKGGYCGLCWPDGIPSRAEWSEYRQEIINNTFRGSWDDWINMLANRWEKKTQLQLTDFPKDEPQTPPRRGILTRIWNFLI